MILDVGDSKSRVKDRFWVRHGDGEEKERDLTALGPMWKEEKGSKIFP